MKKLLFWSLMLTFSSLGVGCNTAEQPVSTTQNRSEITSPSTSIQDEKSSDNDNTENELKTSEQSTYQNAKLGFSFSYSGKYKFQESDTGINVWTESDYEQMESFVEATPLVLSFAENQDNLPLSKWVEESGYLLETEITKETVSGLEAVRFQWSGMWSYTSVVISLPNANQVVVITLDNDTTKEYQVIFEEMVTTLTVF